MYPVRTLIPLATLIWELQELPWIIDGQLPLRVGTNKFFVHIIWEGRKGLTDTITVCNNQDVKALLLCG